MMARRNRLDPSGSGVRSRRTGTTNEIWLIKDSNGKNLAVFQALEKDRTHSH